MKKKTIFRLFIIPLVIVMVIQALISYGTFLLSGTPLQLNNNAVGILKRTVENRKLTLESNMVQNWSDIGPLRQEAQQQLQRILERNGYDVVEFLGDKNAKEEYLGQMITPGLEQMRKSTITGTFLILTDLHAAKGEKECSGIYFRNSGPGTDNSENSDILMERGNASYSHQLGIPLDTCWTTDFHFAKEGEREEDEFFYQPYRAALAYKNTDSENLGFWSRPFTLNDREKDSYGIITYTMPLIYDEEVYGIIGMEISVRYLEKLLPAVELDEEGTGGYILAEYREDGSIQPLVSTFSNSFVPDMETMATEETGYDSLRKLVGGEEGKDTFYANISTLHLYNTNTPFEDRIWAVVGIQSGDKLFGMGYSIVVRLLLAILIGLAFGVFSIYLTVSHLTRPVRELAECISGSSGGRLLDYNSSRIMEIDGLYDVVKELTLKQQKTENSLQEEKERYRIALQSSMDILFSYDVKNGSVDLYNIKEEGGQERRELHLEEAGLRNLLETRVHEDDREILLDMLRNTKEDIYVVFEAGAQDSPEDYRWMELSGRVICDMDGERTKIIGSIRKIHEQKVKELSESDTVRRDAVMGIYKKSTGERLVISELDTGRKGWLVLLDIDKFVDLDEKYGMVFGDAVLEQTAAILRHVVKEWMQSGRKIIAVRMGGDEILLWIEECTRKEVEMLLSDFRGQVAELYQDTSFELYLSGGLAEHTAGEEYPALIDKVQKALTWSKLRGNGQDTVYDELTKRQLRRITEIKEINDIAGVAYDRNLGMIPLVFNFFDKSSDLRGILPVLLIKLGVRYGLSDILITSAEQEFHAVHMSFQWHRESERRVETNAHYFSGEDYERIVEGIEDRMLPFAEEKASEAEKEFFLLPEDTHGFIAPLYDNGRYVGSITYAVKAEVISDRDKGELREISKIIESNMNRDKYDLASRAKSDFLSRMSHEIRTPMNAIMGMTTIALTRTKDSEQVEECLNKIASSSEYLLRLINDILDMSKIESGKMKLELASFSLRELADSAAAMILPQTKNRGIALKTAVYLENEWVLGDSLHLNQVLINLLGNAVKFTPEGGRILFTVCQEDNGEKENEQTVYFSVKDNGIGISEDNRKRIFGSFEQAGADIAKSYGGTGLGLAISEKLVCMMGGQIQLQSEEGMGSDFSFRLSFKQGIRPKEEKKTPEKAHHDRTDRRILLVEDNALNMEIAQTILEMHQYPVETAGDGREAVSLFRSHAPGYYDAILMDIKMPVMDGLEATRRIRSLSRKDARDIPIVAMSANAFAEDVRISLESGMNAHLSKPIDVNKLLKTLDKLLS